MRERERGRERKREKGREREGGREREKEREREREWKGGTDVEYGCFIFIFKRNGGCLGTF